MAQVEARVHLAVVEHDLSGAVLLDAVGIDDSTAVPSRRSIRVFEAPLDATAAAHFFDVAWAAHVCEGVKVQVVQVTILARAMMRPPGVGGSSLFQERSIGKNEVKNQNEKTK